MIATHPSAILSTMHNICRQNEMKLYAGFKTTSVSSKEAKLGGALPEIIKLMRQIAPVLDQGSFGYAGKKFN